MLPFYQRLDQGSLQATATTPSAHEENKMPSNVAYTCRDQHHAFIFEAMLSFLKFLHEPSPLPQTREHLWCASSSLVWALGLLGSLTAAHGTCRQLPTPRTSAPHLRKSWQDVRPRTMMLPGIHIHIYKSTGAV